MEYGVQGCAHRQRELVKQGQNVATGRYAKYPEFMLEANQVHIVHIEEGRCLMIALNIFFVQHKANPFGVTVLNRPIVGREGQEDRLRGFGSQGLNQGGSEGGDATEGRQVISNEGNTSQVCGRFVGI